MLPSTRHSTSTEAVMSNTLPQTQPNVGQIHRRTIAVLAALLLVAAALSIYFIARADDSPSPAPAVHAIRSGGPNETARGQAVGSAAGAEPVLRSGGPNESSRGRAVGSASGSDSDAAGGPDETARGIAASGAGH